MRPAYLYELYKSDKTDVYPVFVKSSIKLSDDKLKKLTRKWIAAVNEKVNAADKFYFDNIDTVIKDKLEKFIECHRVEISSMSSDKLAQELRYGWFFGNEKNYRDNLESMYLTKIFEERHGTIGSAEIVDSFGLRDVFDEWKKLKAEVEISRLSYGPLDIVRFHPVVVDDFFYSPVSRLSIDISEINEVYIDE